MDAVLMTPLMRARAAVEAALGQLEDGARMSDVLLDVVHDLLDALSEIPVWRVGWRRIPKLPEADAAVPLAVQLEELLRAAQRLLVNGRDTRRVVLVIVQRLLELHPVIDAQRELQGAVR